MKLNRIQAVEFFVAIGFKKATEWDDAKMHENLLQVTDRLTVEAIPDKYHKTYEAIAAAKKAGTVIELEAGEPAAAKEKGKAAKPAKAAKAAKEPKAEKPKKEPKPKKEKKVSQLSSATRSGLLPEPLVSKSMQW
jgi:hypothetical protein